MSYSNIKKKTKEKKARTEYLAKVAEANAKKDVEKMMGMIGEKKKKPKSNDA